MTYLPLLVALCLPFGLMLFSVLRVIDGDPDDAWSPYRQAIRSIEQN